MDFHNGIRRSLLFWNGLCIFAEQQPPQGSFNSTGEGRCRRRLFLLATLLFGLIGLAAEIMIYAYFCLNWIIGNSPITVCCNKKLIKYLKTLMIWERCFVLVWGQSPNRWPKYIWPKNTWPNGQMHTCVICPSFKKEQFFLLIWLPFRLFIVRICDLLTGLIFFRI